MYKVEMLDVSSAFSPLYFGIVLERRRTPTHSESPLWVPPPPCSWVALSRCGAALYETAPSSSASGESQAISPTHG